MNPIELSDRFRITEGVVFSEIDGHAVALDSRRGIFYATNGVGLRVLQEIDDAISVASICAKLVSDYEIDPLSCESQVCRLLDSLMGAGLIILQRDDVPTTKSR